MPEQWMVMNCNVCLYDDREPVFRAPYDEIGIPLMREHLWMEHGIDTLVHALVAVEPAEPEDDTGIFGVT